MYAELQTGSRFATHSTISVVDRAEESFNGLQIGTAVVGRHELVKEA